MIKGVKIDSVKTSDYGSIAEFLAQQKAGDLSKEDWQQKFFGFWEDNPFFKEELHARGWVLRDEAGVVCGFVGNIPIGYSKDGHEEISFISTTWFVSPQAQSCGLMLYARFLKQKGVLLNTTPTTKVEEILKEFKFVALESPWIKKDFFSPVNRNALAEYLLSRFKMSSWAKGFGLLSALGIKLAAQSKAALSKKIESTIVVKEIDQLPQDTQGWWDEFKNKYSYTLNRRAMGLNYFFFSDDYRRHRKLLEIREKDKLVGFCGLRKVARKTYSYIEVLDLALLNDTEGIYQALVLEIKKIAAGISKDIAFIKTNAFSDTMQKVLNQEGFWSVAGQGRYYFRDPEGKLTSGDIYGSLLDGDRVCL